MTIYVVELSNGEKKMFTSIYDKNAFLNLLSFNTPWEYKKIKEYEIEVH